jgi:hypothetical protein
MLAPVRRRLGLGIDLTVYSMMIESFLYGGVGFDAARFLAARERYERLVREAFADQPERLLVMNVCEGDGWAQLCPFLSLPVPEQPFPWVNSAVSTPASQ